MKKILTMVLVTSMLLSVAAVPTAFAVWKKEITLFETDFENETPGTAAKTVQGCQRAPVRRRCLYI